MKTKITEKDLALRVVKFFEDLGYISYKEVSLKGKGGNIRSDIYLVFYQDGVIKDTIALETKLNFTLKVIEQSHSWMKYANRCYVVVPRLKRKTSLFGVNVCSNLNVGVIEVDMKSNDINFLFNPDSFNKPKMPPLYEQQRDSEAGNSDSKFITAYKVFLMNLDEYMKDKNDLLLKDVIKEVKHHYKNDTVCYNVVKKYIERNIIDNYYIRKDNKEVYLKHKT